MTKKKCDSFGILCGSCFRSPPLPRDVVVCTGLLLLLLFLTLVRQEEDYVGGVREEKKTRLEKAKKQEINTFCRVSLFR